ncbi:MAG: ATP-binding protein [Lachnospiraceae bacterium]|nr:ATP-binding protein [Lachnospiraceae bacterium]
MLKRVIVKNFKCFRNETVFDFRRTNYKLLEQNTKDKLLKGILYVGDNASGKTTAIEPIVLLLDILFKDKDFDLVIYQCLFALKDNTSLKYEFEIEKHEIEYGFTFKKDDILKEELLVDGIQVIKRIGENAELNFGSEFSIHQVDKSLLFLKRVYFNTRFEGNKILISWFEFLKKSIFVNAYTRNIITYNGELLLLKKYFDKYGVKEVNDFFISNNFKYSIKYEKEIKKNSITYQTDDEEKTVFLERDDISVPIPLFWESTGNITLINMLPSILHSVKNGGLLIIDEFSSGFHNKLEELIVRYIMNEGTNTQLFFVSHSTNLLSNALLRPDQIYAVEMQGSNGSVLNRFSDEQPRVAQNLEKMYLSGVFGGIPEYGTEKG